MEGMSLGRGTNAFQRILTVSPLITGRQAHTHLKAYIYVDDILASAVNMQKILRLLAAIIKAIFTVCNHPNIEVHQCPLSLDKW
jgi:hypothetical protein